MNFKILLKFEILVVGRGPASKDKAAPQKQFPTYDKACLFCSDWPDGPRLALCWPRPAMARTGQGFTGCISHNELAPYPARLKCRYEDREATCASPSPYTAMAEDMEPARADLVGAGSPHRSALGVCTNTNIRQPPPPTSHPLSLPSRNPPEATKDLSSLKAPACFCIAHMHQ